MPTWEQIEQDAPDFAARVRRRFEIGTNQTIATLRRDGAPRISASEVEFGDGQVTLGMMGGSMKLLDVRRDPRVALHSPTIEPPKENAGSWPGDAKLAGRLVETPPPADSPHRGSEASDSNPHIGAGFFRVDVTEVVLTYVGDPPDHLVIESWHPSPGWRRRTRT